MAACDHCGSTILFGGSKQDGLTFCNETCAQSGYLIGISQQIPDDVVAQQTLQIHAGLCPRCEGSGPVDVHTAHKVWSLLVLTQWNSTPQISCRGCGVKAQLGGLAFSLLLGWWGFPWGLIMTPVQIVRNISGMLSPPDETRPSEQMQQLVRRLIAAHALEQQSGA